MSLEQNVRDLLAAMVAFDKPAALKCLNDDATWSFPASVPFKSNQLAKDALDSVTGSENMFRDGLKLTIHDIVVNDAEAKAEYTIEGVTSKGIDYKNDCVMCASGGQDGKIQSVRLYVDTALAMSTFFSSGFLRGLIRVVSVIRGNKRER